MLQKFESKPYRWNQRLLQKVPQSFTQGVSDWKFSLARYVMGLIISFGSNKDIFMVLCGFHLNKKKKRIQVKGRMRKRLATV